MLKRRLLALECLTPKKQAQLEIIRPGVGWVWIKWGNLTIKPVREDLWDAI